MLEYDRDSGAFRCHDPEMCKFIADSYRAERYLACVSAAALNARLHGLVALLTVFDPTRGLTLSTPNSRSGIALIELLAEYDLRSVDAFACIERHMNRLAAYFASRRPDDMVDLWRHISELTGRKCLFKFTSCEHVDAALRGEVRFRTASSYKNAGFNIAIRDDELNIEHILKGACLTSPETGKMSPVIGGRVGSSAAGDYYVSCFSVTCNLNLFALFEVDACVVIENADVFVDQVIRKHRTRHSDFEIIFQNVDYIDSFRQLKSRGPFECKKTMDFEYEQEYRFAAWPRSTDTLLEEIRIIPTNTSEVHYRTIYMRRRE